jgi:hypothetical protein
MAAFIGPATADDELGVWQPASPAAPADSPLESAGLDLGGGAGRDGVSLWQIALPAERSAAVQALNLAEARLAVAETALPQAAGRLTAFVAAGGPSLAVAPGLEAPELELNSWAALSQSVGSSGSWERSSQPIDDLVALPAIQQVAERMDAFFDKVRETLRNPTVVETDSGDARVALTHVSWTGDTHTVWAVGLPADDAQQHVRALRLALRTRDTWLRLALIIVRGAIQLTALFAAAPLLALPAAYRFVRQIIDQLQALQALSTPT